MRIRKRPQIPACPSDLEKTSHDYVGDCRAGAPLRVPAGVGVLHSDGDLPIEFNGCNVDGSVGSSDGVAGRDLKLSPSDLRLPMVSRVVSRVDDGKVTQNKGTNWVCSFHLLLSLSLSSLCLLVLQFLVSIWVPKHSI